jgi:hypothetical protein
MNLMINLLELEGCQQLLGTLAHSESIWVMMKWLYWMVCEFEVALTAF